MGWNPKIDYPTWLLNIVLKNKVGDDHYMCIDFANAHTTTLKDFFPLPNIEQLVDATTRFEVISFMDAYSVYHQIHMHPRNEEKKKHSS